MRHATESEPDGLELDTAVDDAEVAASAMVASSDERWDNDPTTLAPGQTLSLLVPMILPLRAEPDDLDEPDDGFPAGSCRFPLTAEAELYTPLPNEPDEASIEADLARLDLGRPRPGLARIAARAVVVMTLTVSIGVITSIAAGLVSTSPGLAAITSAAIAFAMVLGLYGGRWCLGVIGAAVAAAICLVPVPSMAAVVALGLPVIGGCLYRVSGR